MKVDHQRMDLRTNASLVLCSRSLYPRFGDYEDDYITVLTDEGEAHAQLIVSYIDQILKTRVDIDRVVKDYDDEIADAENMDGEWQK